MSCHPFATRGIIGKQVPKMHFASSPIVGLQRLPCCAFRLRDFGDDLYVRCHTASPFVARGCPGPFCTISCSGSRLVSPVIAWQVHAIIAAKVEDLQNAGPQTSHLSRTPRPLIVGRGRCAGSLAVTTRLDADSFVHAALVFTKTIPACVSRPHANATATMTSVWNNA